jgi:hypothetical protein
MWLQWAAYRRDVDSGTIWMVLPSIEIDMDVKGNTAAVGKSAFIRVGEIKTKNSTSTEKALDRIELHAKALEWVIAVGRVAGYACNSATCLQQCTLPATVHLACNSATCLQQCNLPATVQLACNSATCLQVSSHTCTGRRVASTTRQSGEERCATACAAGPGSGSLCMVCLDMPPGRPEGAGYGGLDIEGWIWGPLLCGGPGCVVLDIGPAIALRCAWICRRGGLAGPVVGGWIWGAPMLWGAGCVGLDIGPAVALI